MLGLVCIKMKPDRIRKGPKGIAASRFSFPVTIRIPPNKIPVKDAIRRSKAKDSTPIHVQIAAVNLKSP